MTQVDMERQVNGMTIKDLRVELRGRGLNPAGGMEALRERLLEDMSKPVAAEARSSPAGPATAEAAEEKNLSNNYSRPDGQNVGNFITDRPSSRVLAQPGGASQISLGWEEPEKPAAKPSPVQEPVAAPVQPAEGPAGNQDPGNNYSRPDGQNTGNFITDRPSSKVLAPPGGASNVCIADIEQTSTQNNYSRPGGQQNVGNFITDRPSSRVLQNPGGSSQIVFG